VYHFFSKTFKLKLFDPVYPTMTYDWTNITEEKKNILFCIIKKENIQMVQGIK